MIEKLYYILCEEHRKGDEALWWGPNCGGYVTDMNNAGKYTRDEVLKATSRDFAVPVDEIDPLSVTRRIADAGHARDLVIPRDALRKDRADELAKAPST